MPSITERTYQWAKPLVPRGGPPTGFIWHHAAASTASAAKIHSWHLGQGWSGIGYHFVVRKTGMIERGRPENVIGSHTMYVNERIGVCVEGNLQTETMPPAQLASVIWLQAYLVKKYGAKPTTRHSDHAATACPGKNFPWPIPKPVTTQQAVYVFNADTAGRKDLLTKAAAAARIVNNGFTSRGNTYVAYVDTPAKVDIMLKAAKANGIMVQSGQCKPVPLPSSSRQAAIVKASSGIMTNAGSDAALRNVVNQVVNAL